MRRPEPKDDELDAVVSCDFPDCGGRGRAEELYCHGCRAYVCGKHPSRWRGHTIQGHAGEVGR